MFKRFFDLNEKHLNRLRPIVTKINELEKEVQSWSDEKFREETQRLREKIQKSEDPQAELTKILPAAFAMVREASLRTIGLRHHDVQIMAGIVGHEGNIFEQKTGEGKTLTSTLPLYLNALTGEAVHSVTVNDFLSRRDMGWNGPIFHFLGITLASIIHENSYIFDPEFEDHEAQDARMRHLKPVPRTEAYKADIVYGTNAQFGFDYLRDNMVQDISQMVQRGHFYALIDEVDSILIDEARTPLIISSPAEEAVDKYYTFAKMADALTKDTDYEVDEKFKRVNLTDIGIRKLEKQLGIDNLFEKDFEVLHHVENALKSKAVFEKDRDYVVRDGELVIVDEFTGRLMFGRRFSEGLHQALEAKENLPIQRESKTLATITIQNYFRSYTKLAGMTGTAKTEEEEFFKIYKLEVVTIPTNQPMIRADHPDMVFKTESAKYRAIVNAIEELHETGQPVLVGTTSIQKNELLDSLLTRRKIPHKMLNAKNHEQEAQIIAEAGHLGAVTLATNIAGRGVDIELGGAGPKKYEGEEWSAKRLKDWEDEHEKVLGLGGLHVLGTERHESRRIDNQLRGRSGRQGDPGSSRFYVSLEDDLMRIFGGERVASVMGRLNMDENIPIESKIVSRTIEGSQQKVESFNFDTRKHVLDYDDVNNMQRNIIYRMRLNILRALETKGVTEDDINFKEWMLDKLYPYDEEIEKVWSEKEKNIGGELFERVIQQVSLDIIDVYWMEMIDVLQHIKQDVSLRGYAQRDTVMEYKKEARELFERLIDDIFATIAERVRQLEKGTENVEMTKPPEELKVEHQEMAPFVITTEENPVAKTEMKPTPIQTGKKIGRNDPCPCGAIDPQTGHVYKYKKCGLINAPHHKG